VHGKKYSQNEVSIVNDPIVEKEGRLTELKQKFVDGDVTLDEYQEQIENINQRFSVTHKHVYASLDIGKVMARDRAHIATFIDVMSDYEFESTAALIKSNNHIEAFTRLLKNQVQFAEDYTGMTMTYLGYGQLMTRNIDVDEVITLYRGLVNGMMKHVLPKILTSIDDYSQDDPGIDAALGPSNYYQQILNGLGEAFMTANRTALYNSLEVAMTKLNIEIYLLSDV
jgi:hypothetical protein